MILDDLDRIKPKKFYPKKNISQYFFKFFQCQKNKNQNKFKILSNIKIPLYIRHKLNIKITAFW